MRSHNFTRFLHLLCMFVLVGLSYQVKAQQGCCDISAASPALPLTVGANVYTRVNVTINLDNTFECDAVLDRSDIPNITSSYPTCTKFNFWRADDLPTDATDVNDADQNGTNIHPFSTNLQRFDQVSFNVDSLRYHLNSAGAGNTSHNIFYYVTVSNPNNPNCYSTPIALRVRLVDNNAPIVQCPIPAERLYYITCAQTTRTLTAADIAVSSVIDNCSGEDLVTVMTITDACGAISIYDNDPLTPNSEYPIAGYAFPIGTSTVEYQVIDEFNNAATCSLDITVRQPDPLIACNQSTVNVSLPGLNYDGRDTAIIPAATFLQYFDDPCIAGSESALLGTRYVVRVSTAADPTDLTAYEDELYLTCPDVNTTRNVYIRIFDLQATACNGDAMDRFSNYCQSAVRLIDTHGPTISCTPAINIPCERITMGTSPTELYNYFRSLPTSISAAADSARVWPIISDNCNNLSLTYFDQIPNVAGSNCYQILRHWVVTDNNLAFETFKRDTCVQTINAIDLERPRITSIAGPATYNCNNPLPNPNIVMTDNCATSVDLAASLVLLSTQSTQATALNNYSRYNYSVTRNYRISDNCGNFRDTFHVTSYIDSVAPVFANISFGTLPNLQTVIPTKIFDNANVNQYPSVRDRDSFAINTPIILSNANSDCLADLCFTITWDDCAAPYMSSNYQLITANGTVYTSGIYAGSQICVNNLPSSSTFTLLINANDPSYNLSTLRATIQTPAAFGPIAVCHDTVNLVLNNLCVGDVTSWDFDNGSHSYCNNSCPPYADYLCRAGLRDMWIVRLDANGNPIAATTTGDNPANDETTILSGCNDFCDRTSTSDASNRMTFNSSLIGTHRIRLYVKDQYGIDSCTSTLRVLGSSTPITATTSVATPTTATSTGTITVNVTGGPGGIYTYQLLPSGTPQTSNVFTVPSGTYSIRVSSSAGCSTPLTLSNINVTPCVPGVIGVATSSTAPTSGNNGTISAKVPAMGGGTAPYTFTLNPGNLVIIADSAATFTGLASGSYTLLVTSNAGICGFNSGVLNVNVNPGSSTGTGVTCQNGTATTSPVFTISSVTGVTGSTQTITVVAANNFTNLTSALFTIGTSDASIASIEPNSFTANTASVPNTMFAANNSLTNYISVNWLNSAPVSLPAGTQLFSFRVRLNGASGQSAQLFFADNDPSTPGSPAPSPLSPTDIVTTTSGGALASIPACFTYGTVSIGATTRKIAGSVTTECNAPVVGTEVAIDGNMTMMANTDAAGYYEKSDMFTNATITPEKDINYNNGVSTIDLVIIQQHILGISPITSPYKLIAADADKSNSISVIDLIELQRLILGASNDIANNTSWRFIPSNYTFSGSPFASSFPESATYATVTTNITQNFTAVKVGDVNCSANANLNGGAQDRNLDGIFTFAADDKRFAAGDVVTMTLRAKDFYNMLGYQMTLEFEKDALTFNHLQVGDMSGLQQSNFNTKAIANGYITMNWFNATPVRLADETALVTFTFTAKKAGQLSDVVSATSNHTLAEAYRNDDKTMDVALSFNGQTQDAGDFALNQNRPNPFKHQTVISFNLPTAATATLKVYDMAGKVLKVVEGDYHRGYNEITLDSKELNATGVLYYQLSTANHSATQRMIVIE